MILFQFVYSYKHTHNIYLFIIYVKILKKLFQKKLDSNLEYTNNSQNSSKLDKYSFNMFAINNRLILYLFIYLFISSCGCRKRTPLG